MMIEIKMTAEHDNDDQERDGTYGAGDSRPISGLNLFLRVAEQFRYGCRRFLTNLACIHSDCSKPQQAPKL